MPLVLGIDTGGTFTDGVIIDPPKRKVLSKSKAPTTKQDLLKGILRCIDKFSSEELGRVRLVSLSTTLATNAIVEGRKGRVGLILIGKKPDGDLPVENSVLLEGLFDIKGREKELLREEKIAEVVEEFKSHKLDSLAISGYASVRNPGHESRVREIVSGLWDIPVVCAHDLSSSLGFLDRTVTSVLNAGLIPVINELIGSVKTALEIKGISARLMIVKGDGTLMDEAYAKFRPIDTILSGPASSVMGGLFLSGYKDGIILDMGGTTTDIAEVSGGKVNVQQSGALVGGRKTHVRAAEIHTFGIGGDSRIQIDSQGGITIGSAKVRPLSDAGSEYSHLADELKEYRKPEGYELFTEQETDCFGYLKIPENIYLSDRDKSLLECLRERPHALFYLADKFGTDSESLGLSRLTDSGAVERISLTPTDILHVTESYTPWNREIARIGCGIMAEKAGKSMNEFIQSVSDGITDKLTASLAASLTDREAAEQISMLLDKMVRKKDKTALTMGFTLEKPFVAVGAPVAAWIPPVSRELGAELIIPEFAEVANAIGAATGQVMETAEILIRYSEEDETYTVYAPWERMIFSDLQAAIDFSAAEGSQWVSALVREEGSDSPEIIFSREDLFIGNSEEDHTFVETRIRITGIGSPDWEEKED